MLSEEHCNNRIHVHTLIKITCSDPTSVNDNKKIIKQDGYLKKKTNHD